MAEMTPVLKRAIEQKYKSAALAYYQAVEADGETSIAAALAATRLLARGDLARQAGLSEFRIAKLLYQAQAEVNHHDHA